jgi:hypothetical protein
MVLKYAFAFNKGDYSGTASRKVPVNIYPYQLGFILRMNGSWLHISENPRISFSSISAFVLLINYLTWQITDLLSENNRSG